jgi:hypothetical protein
MKKASRQMARKVYLLSLSSRILSREGQIYLPSRIRRG